MFRRDRLRVAAGPDDFVREDAAGVVIVWGSPTHRGLVARDAPDARIDWDAGPKPVVPRSSPPARRPDPLSPSARWLQLHARSRLAVADPEAERAWIARLAAGMDGACRCAPHWREYLAAHPPTVETPNEYEAWAVAAHNAVNRRLGKPELTVEQAREAHRPRWVSRPTAIAGVVTGANAQQEDLLPWWLANLRRHHPDLPVFFADFGLSGPARQWCRENGSLIEGVRAEGDRAWFGKAAAMLHAGGETVVWIDADAQVVAPIDALWTTLRPASGFGLVADQPQQHPGMGNGGVVVVRHGDAAVVRWAELCQESTRGSDQDVLYHDLGVRATLPQRYNTMSHQHQVKDAAILHWAGRPAKTYARRHLVAKGVTQASAALHVQMTSSGQGLGDTIVGLYAACGLAESTGRTVVYHARGSEWVKRASHPGVVIDPHDGDMGVDISGGWDGPFGYHAATASAPSRVWAYCRNLALGFGVAPFAPVLPAVDRAIVAPRAGGRYAVLSPFTSQWPAREWPAGKWTALADRLLGAGTAVIAIGSGDQKDRLERTFDGLPGVQWRYGCCADEMVDLMLGASVTVSNDSGIAHLGGLLNVPTVAIHAGSLPHEYLFAMAPSVRSVIHPFATGRRDANQDLLRTITVDRVAAVVMQAGSMTDASTGGPGVRG